MSCHVTPRVLLAGHQLKNVEEYLSWWGRWVRKDDEKWPEAAELIPKRRMDLEEPWVVCENIEAATARLQSMAVSGLKVVRVNENRDTHGRRVRLFKKSATGAATGLPDGQPKREKVWVPTDAFLPCMTMSFPLLRNYP